MRRYVTRPLLRGLALACAGLVATGCQDTSREAPRAPEAAQAPAARPEFWLAPMERFKPAPKVEVWEGDYLDLSAVESGRKRPYPLTPGEKTPLDVLLGKRKPNRAQKAALRLEVAPPPAPPKAAAVEPLRPEPAAVPGWVVPPEIAAQLTHREVLLLQIEDNRLDARHVYNKIFLAFKSSAFSEEDVPALLAAGWVWQDILVEDDGVVRTL